MATDQTLNDYQLTPSVNHPLSGDDGSVGGNYPFFQVAQDVEAALRGVSIDCNWQDFSGLTGVAFTYISATQFGVGSVNFTPSGSNQWRVGSQLKALVTAGTIYGTITAIQFAGGAMTVTAVWLNGASLDAGLTNVFLSAVQADSQGSLPSSVLTQNNAPNYCAITNSGVAWTGTLEPPIAAYTAGATYKFLFSGAASQGSDTVNLNGLGAKNLTKNGDSTPLAAGDISDNQIAEFVYDGTEFQLQGSVFQSAEVTAYKSNDQAITNSVVLVNDNALEFAVEANQTWNFEIELYVTAGAGANNGGLQVQLNGPSGSAIVFSSSANSSGQGYAGSTPVEVLANGSAITTYLVKLFGVIINGATVGTLQLQIAQQSAVTTATTVKAGSNLIATLVN